MTTLKPEDKDDQKSVIYYLKEMSEAHKVKVSEDKT